VLFGGARYDINADKFNQTNVGLGYIDDCLILALNYVTGYSYSGPTVTTNNQIMLQLSLRTLGNTNVSQTVGTSGTSSSGATLPGL
jgi:LPS-assembly protein